MSLCRNKVGTTAMVSQYPLCDTVAYDTPSVKVYEDDATYAFMDIHPGSNGRTLVHRQETQR